MKIARAWGVPNKNTFDCPPIGKLVQRYLKQSMLSIDPFSRDRGWATYTNDLNPRTSATWHLDAMDFLKILRDQYQLSADMIIFDPPYSPRQVKKSYANIGIGNWNKAEVMRVGTWSKEKNVCRDLLEDGGIFMHFGWHSNALGKVRGAEIIEVLLVAHGRATYDTICTVERIAK